MYVRKLPSGNWNAVVRLPNGKRKSISDPLKRVVEQKARALEAAVDAGSYAAVDHRFTVEQWHADWIGTRNVESATTAKNDSHWRNHVQPRWGVEPLTSIRRSQVQRWVLDMTRAGVGANTVHAVYNLLAGMLADAVLEGRLGASPCREIDLPRIVKPEPRWFSKEEYGRIQLALDGEPIWQALVGLGCYSGLRFPGELAGLDVTDVDLSRHMVYVHQVLTRKGMRDYGKTSASTRWVPFPPQVAELLWKVIGDRGQGPVFLAPEGGRIGESNFRQRVWKPALQRAGVAYESPYTMRHTAASWLAQAGVPDYEIAKLLGHSSTRMVSTYAHLAPDVHDRIRLAWGNVTESLTLDAWSATASPAQFPASPATTPALTDESSRTGRGGGVPNSAN